MGDNPPCWGSPWLALKAAGATRTMAGSAAQGEGAPAPRRGLPPPLDSPPWRASGSPACPSLAPESSPLCKSNMPFLLPPSLQEDIFEWHFAIRGAWDSEFEVCRVQRGSAGVLGLL